MDQIIQTVGQMGWGTVSWVVLVTAVTVMYLSYPPPQLSNTLTQWLKRGDYFKYNGYNIFYVVETGTATDDSTLLLIHGYPSSSHDWIKILDDMKKIYTNIVMVDMLGFGFSDKPQGHEYLITEQADILEAVMTSLHKTQVHVMSHDYGDTVALELLHRFNNKRATLTLHSLCLLNGGIFPETNFPILGQKLLLIPYVGDILAHLAFYRVFHRGFGSIFGPLTKPSEEEMWDFYTFHRFNHGNTVSPRIIHYITQRGQNRDRWEGALREARIPVHVIYGPADPVNPPAFVDHYKKVAPNPSITVLDSDIGHYPQWEAPQAVVKNYLEFKRNLK